MAGNARIELSFEEIFSLARDALMAHGANRETAEAVAHNVMNAERDGSVSHGLFRIPGYVDALKSGMADGRAVPRVEEVTPVVFRCDANHGLAPLVHECCLGKLTAAAQRFGVAAVSIKNSHHYSALWPEVEKISAAGLVGITSVSYLPWVAPAGGKTPIFGTNPFAFAWPRPNEDPIVIDMATSSMAMGEVQVAARDGHEVPLGTGLTASGELTTHAAEIVEGVLLPFGGHKGSALALMVELLSGPLVGDKFSYETEMCDQENPGATQGGQFIMALSPDILSDRDWASQTEEFLKKYGAIDGARLPGQRRHAKRRDKGPRSINAELIEKIQGLCDGS
jgi:delta1-piperideine-2-carboxylate reductase